MSMRIYRNNLSPAPRHPPPSLQGYWSGPRPGFRCEDPMCNASSVRIVMLSRSTQLHPSWLEHALCVTRRYVSVNSEMRGSFWAQFLALFLAGQGCLIAGILFRRRDLIQTRRNSARAGASDGASTTARSTRKFFRQTVFRQQKL